MSFNAVDAYWDSFKAFLRERGGLPSSGMRGRGVHSFFKLGQENYPATTWGDVFLFSQQFIRKTDPTPEDCYQQGIIEYQKCLEVSDFVHTSQFNRARSDWEKWMPQNRVNTSTLATKITSGEIYPHNEAFWGYGKDYARARNAAGVVEGSWSMAKKSVMESVAELPDNLKKAADVAADAIPDPTPWIKILKWGSVAGGLFMLYWYVLRPKPKRLSQ